MSTKYINYNLATGEVSGATSIVGPVRDVIRRIRKRTADLRGLWNILADDFYKTNEELVFSQRGSGHFRDLSDFTKAKKFLSGVPVYPILVEGGDLRTSLTKRRSRLASTIIRKKSMTIQPKVPYGGFHQKSTRFMPARPPINLSDARRNQRWSDKAGAWALSQGVSI